MNDFDKRETWRCQRRQVLGGVAGAVSMALFGTACSPESEKESSTPAPVVQIPESIPVGNGPLDPRELADARELLKNHVSIDLHCHPGMFFFDGITPEDPAVAAMAETAGFQDRVISDMAAGQLTVGLFATVADIPLIGAGEQGLFARREFEPGEAYADHHRQVRVLENMVETGKVMAVRSPEDISAVKEAGRVGVIFATEGGDFLEQRGERIEEAYDAGIRSIGLVHYHTNDIGDIQTAAPVHGGLTEFGKEAIAEMNRLGMIIDLAHATFETSRDVAELTSQPVMVSHSFVADNDVQHPRLLSEEHARVIAETDGLVGAWPTGIGNPDFGSFVDRLIRLVDLIGIDHVGLGTDMDANFRPVFTNYRQLPQLPASLKDKGMHDEEIVKLLGGNFIRLFSEVTGNA